MQASLFTLISGMIAQSQAAMVTMMLDSVPKTEGLAQRLRTLRKVR